MDGAVRNPTVLNWTIWLGAVGFIAILALSAVFDPTIRWLHFFQGLMYVAVIALTARGSRWGLYLGVSVAAFWNYSAIFVNSFFRSGLHWLGQSLAQGKLMHVDQIISVFAVGFHTLMIVGCLAAYAFLPRKSWKDLVAWLVTLVAQGAYFYAIVRLFQPRYLTLFDRLLHPHAL